MRIFSESFYLNEHLWYGHIGHFLLISAFVLALMTCIVGVQGILSKTPSVTLTLLSKRFFGLHTLCVWMIMGLLLFMFSQKLYEYHYIWRHSSSDLPWYFILSAMWEGQEGSFLLWIFWQSILGLLLMRKNDTLSLQALAILAGIQGVLMTMILGIDIGGKLIGSNPFVLLRNEMNIPIMEKANYLEYIKDGNGLNQLLQNYWMVIHPPILFLGFASVSIPYSFAMVSLIRKEFVSWTSSALPWILFSICTLGTGILMGGKWAYEALSFGGFWAWDPVENASLVPWLFMVAGLHTLLIFRVTQHSLKATYLFIIVSFAFILYSTFLTRSGILGDSSVHSFTDLGMTGQLLIFILLFVLPALMYLAYYWTKIPENPKEEQTSSREFWLFLGTLFIAVSAIQITYTTSIPVWNKLFGLKLAPPLNANEHYNSIQIWFTIVVTGLMTLAPFLAYFSTNYRQKLPSLIMPSIISAVLIGVVFYHSEIPFVQQYKIGIKDYQTIISFVSSYFLVLMTSIMLLVFSIYYIWYILRSSNKMYWGGSIAHLGFALLVLGALLSQYQKKTLSINRQGVDFGKNFNEEEQTNNILLVKDKEEKMQQYDVTYQSSILSEKKASYHLLFKNSKNPTDSFVLIPEAKFIKEGTKSRLQAEPSIKHFWNKDIFTHISSVPDKEESDKSSHDYPVKLKDSFFVSNYKLKFDHVSVIPATDNKQLISVKAYITIAYANRTIDTLIAPFQLNTKSGAFTNPKIISKDKELELNIAKIAPETNEFVFNIKEKNPINDWIILKTIEFPHINILWLGCILIGLGSGMSAWYRKTKVRHD